MSDTSHREWRFYLNDMIDFAGKVLAYTAGLDQTGWTAAGNIRVSGDSTIGELAGAGDRLLPFP